MVEAYGMSSLPAVSRPCRGGTKQWGTSWSILWQSADKRYSKFSGKYGNCADVSRLPELHQDLSIRQKPKSTSGQVVIQPVSPALAGEWEDPAPSPFSNGCLCCRAWKFPSSGNLKKTCRQTSLQSGACLSNPPEARRLPNWPSQGLFLPQPECAWDYLTDKQINPCFVRAHLWGTVCKELLLSSFHQHFPFHNVSVPF